MKLSRSLKVGLAIVMVAGCALANQNATNTIQTRCNNPYKPGPITSNSPAFLDHAFDEVYNRTVAALCNLYNDTTNSLLVVGSTLRGDSIKPKVSDGTHPIYVYSTGLYIKGEPPNTAGEIEIFENSQNGSNRVSIMAAENMSGNISLKLPDRGFSYPSGYAVLMFNFTDSLTGGSSKFYPQTGLTQSGRLLTSNNNTDTVFFAGSRVSASDQAGYKYASGSENNYHISLTWEENGCVDPAYDTLAVNTTGRTDSSFVIYHSKFSSCSISWITHGKFKYVAP